MEAKKYDLNVLLQSRIEEVEDAAIMIMITRFFAENKINTEKRKKIIRMLNAYYQD